jgi:predicted component of type VI protein secretion system
VIAFPATVQMRGDSWMLADAKSTNGTRLNGRPLQGDRPRKLHDSDLIEIGAYVLSFHTGVLVPEPVSAERTAELARRLLRDAYGARAQAMPAPRLCVVSGPQTGKLLEIAPAPSRALIGRQASCALALAGTDVAPEHLEVVHDQDGVLVRAVGEQVFRVAGLAQRSRRLRDGDEISVGETRLLFEEPAQVAIEALKHEPDLTFTPAPRTDTEATAAASAAPAPAEQPPPPALEPISGFQPQAASGRSDADLLIYALAAIVLIASTLGLLVLLRL